MIVALFGFASSERIVQAQAGMEPSRPALGPAVADDPMQSVLPREQIDARHQWNLEDIFPSEAAWEQAFANVEAMVKEAPKYKGTLGQSAASLLAGLKFQDQARAELDRVMVYAGLRHHEDMSISDNQGRFDRVQMLATRAAEATSWIVPEILRIPPETITGWMKEDKKLAVYEQYIRDIHRQREHVLSEREEALLAMAGDVAATPGNVFAIYTNTELDFPMIKDESGKEIRLTNGLYGSLIDSRDRRVRRDAFLGMHRTYQSKKNSIAAMLSGQVKQHMFYAKARSFGSSLEAALHGPGIPVEVYTNLIATVNAHTSKLHRYAALKRKMLGLDDIHRYDLYVPMVEMTEKKIPYDGAVETILQALAPLGKDYVGTLRTAFESRWIDVYETPNKRSGAYCWGSYLTHPYLLLNYHGTMNDRSTIAHEMGHAMHSWYTVKEQPMIYGDYATFCAEVASTVNEVLLAHYLLNNASSDQERMLIIEKQLEGIRTTVFRQTMFAEFEKSIHEMAEAGRPLTGEVLTKTYGELVRRYYGPEIVLDDCASAEGLRIPHFYRNFYVYTYATSYCAATNIARRIIAGDQDAVRGLMNFLSAGSSAYPLDVLKLAGVDMTTPQPIADTMELFAEMMDQFEALHARQHTTQG